MIKYFKTITIFSVFQLLLMYTPVFSQWKSMNPAGLAGTDGKITSLVYHDGILYAGGEFTIAGTGFARNVAQWDGKEWAPVGKGINAPVSALCSDGKGRLYAAVVMQRNSPRGYRSRSKQGAGLVVICEWDGKKWRNIGIINQGLKHSGRISDMVCDSKGRLYVSGSFRTVETCKAVSIAWWDGKIWHPVGDGKGFPLGENKYSGDQIYGLCVGKKDIIYGINRSRIGCWDGSAWSFVGDGPDGNPQRLALDKKGRLVAGGEFRRKKNQKSLPLAFYKGDAWEYPEIKFSSRVNALAFNGKGTLHIGSNSSVRAVDKNELRGLAGPGNEEWLQGHVQAMTFDPEGNLYAAGYGISIGGRRPSVSILKWDGARWHRMFSQSVHTASAPNRPVRKVLPENLPLPDFLDSHKIKSLAITPNGHVFISGDFEVFIGKECLSRLALWDGKTWHAVGPGLPAPAKILAADVFGNVYAAGRFPSGEWNGYHNLMHWNGMEWKPIKYVPDGITALACDASGYLYIGTAASSKDSWQKSLCRWDDSTLTVMDGAPGGCHPDFIPKGAINQLDIIGSELHVQGNFTMAGGMISPGYAVYDLGSPDAGRIKSKQTAMQRAAGQVVERNVTVTLEEAYCNLSTDRVTRFEKMEISNQTTGALDSAVLYTPDSSGFTYDKTEEKWGHVTQRPAISRIPPGFRFSFPLGQPLLPGKKRPLWIWQSLPGRVTSVEPDAWICKDTLRTIFTNVEVKPGWDKRSLYRLSVVEYDSFTVIHGDGDQDARYTTIEGPPGTPCEVLFAVKPEYDPVCAGVMAYVDYTMLINAYTPPPRGLLPKIKKLSRVKQELLARELLKWCFSLRHPLGVGDLWEMIGEDPDGTVPEPEELKKRFGEMSKFYLKALAAAVPGIGKEMYRMVLEKVHDWRLPECGSAGNPVPGGRLEGDMIYCDENSEDVDPEIGFYPIELIRSTLKLLGPGAGKSLRAFEDNF